MATPPFPDVTVILPDPRLPDRTKVGHVFAAEDLDSIERLRTALGELPGYRFDYLDDHTSLLERLQRDPPQFVLNCCDTGYRNVPAQELHVPALLEVFGIPYTGSPPACLGLCYDKANVRAIAGDCGVPVPAQRYLSNDEEPGADIRFPAIVKPNAADGSFGITADSVIEDTAALRARILRLRRECPGQGVLVQEFLAGDEYGLTLIGNRGAGFRTLPVLTVDFGGLPEGLPHVLGYESKTLPDSPYWQQLRYRKAELAGADESRLAAAAEQLFSRLGCRDYARFDFRTGGDGEIRLLEVNPNPAWCWDGKMNLMAGFAGLGYPELLGAILETAQRRVAEI